MLLLYPSEKPLRTIDEHCNDLALSLVRNGIFGQDSAVLHPNLDLQLNHNTLWLGLSHKRHLLRLVDPFWITS